MKKIEVFFSSQINTDKLEDKLYPAGARSLSLVEMRVLNQGPAKTEKYRGVERSIRYSSRIKAEIIVDNDDLNRITLLLSDFETTDNERPQAFVSELSAVDQPAVTL